MEHEYRPYQPIENYGVIGDLQTVALVGLDGSIDFMSFPRFDSPTLFASILDARKGGYFAVEPQMENYKSKQLYLPGTAILVTRFFAEAGIAELIDYMPLKKYKENSTSAIVRKIQVIRGTITFKVKCAPRFDYARATHQTQVKDGELYFASINDGNARIRLIADIELQERDGDGYAEFTLGESEIAHIILESVEAADKTPDRNIEHYTRHTYRETINDWRKWIRKSTYSGRWQELVQRSAITLKLLTSYQYGSVVAAATFGLPETIGGNRNWDYRYTWTRDAAFTMYAFLSLGFYDEAGDFLTWIFDMCKTSQLQLLYRVDGGTDLTEQVLGNLEGYMESQPVRIGNAAHDQLQIDIYGELIDTIYIYNKSHKPITFEFWLLICQMVNEVLTHGKEPDDGIWEIRNERREFLHTRLMCWVAIDRAIKIGEQRTFPYPRIEWITARNELYHEIFNDFWNEDLKTWVQYKGAKVVDASCLLMPLTHFIAPTEPRWISTMEAIGKTLKLDVLLYRYKNSTARFDGLDGEEGTFNLCSFWYIEALAKSGKVEEAAENFERMIGYANHLGLFSEELGKKGEHLGNFPQAFTHLAMISAALELNKQLARVR